MAQTVLRHLDRAGRPGWIVCDPRDGLAVGWVPFKWLARLWSGHQRHLDYVKPGEGW